MNGFIRVALYARVSSQKQADERTIESQKQALLERLQRDGFQLDPNFMFCDDGYSGSTLQRPALESLRDQIALSVIHRVYILSPDRLSRKMAHQAILLDEFSKQQCDVIFLSQEGLPDSPESNLLIQMQGMIAEYEREKILERTRRGRRHAAVCGSVSVFGRAPYGYRYISKAAGGGKACWEIDPEKSRTVRFMFEQVGKHQVSIRAICRELESREIVSPKGNSQWVPATVHGILTNPAYCGQAKYGKQHMVPRKPGNRAKRGDPPVPRQAKVAVATPVEEQVTISVPAIVSESLFEIVGLCMKENRQRQRQWKSGSKYLLSGMLICGQCGSAYCSRRQGGGKYHYYRCIGTDGSRQGYKPICSNSSVCAGELETEIWRDVCQLLRDPSRLAAELKRRQSQPSELADQLANQTRRVDKLRQQMDRLIDVYTEGVIEKADFTSRLARLRSRHDQETATLAGLQDHLAAPDVALAAQNLQALAEQVSDQLDSATDSLKRSVLKLLIKHIEIHPEEVRIIYKVPQNPFELGHLGGHFLQHCSRRPAVPTGTNLQIRKTYRSEMGNREVISGLFLRRTAPMKFQLL